MRVMVILDGRMSFDLVETKQLPEMIGNTDCGVAHGVTWPTTGCDRRDDLNAIHPPSSLRTEGGGGSKNLLAGPISLLEWTRVTRRGTTYGIEGQDVHLPIVWDGLGCDTFDGNQFGVMQVMVILNGSAKHNFPTIKSHLSQCDVCVCVTEVCPYGNELRMKVIAVDCKGRRKKHCQVDTSL